MYRSRKLNLPEQESRRRAGTRETGHAMTLVLMILFVLLGLTGLLFVSTARATRIAGESQKVVDSLYLADSGAQIAASMIRSYEGTFPDTSFVEDLFGGIVSVSITDVGEGLYRVDSAGSLGGIQQSVEMYVSPPDPVFSRFPGAVSVAVGDSDEAEITIKVKLQEHARLSGLDHDRNGNRLSDQENATYGIAVPESLRLSASASRIEGEPDLIDEAALNDTRLLKKILQYTSENADITLVGETTVDSSDTGRYGTPDQPVLVHARLGGEDQIHMEDDFVGHGLLVVEWNGDRIRESVVQLEDDSKWHGIILFNVGPLENRRDDRSAYLLSMKDSSRIIGGLAFLLDASLDSRTVRAVKAKDSARVLASSVVVNDYTPDELASEIVPFRIVGYRGPTP